MRSDDPDGYDVAGDGPEVEVRVKGSRFVGQTFAVVDRDDVCRRLETVRRRYHDATHHGSASRVGPPGGVRVRFDDDGEPSGTTGRPILAAIEGRGLHDALVVVTRWFGGTKLGTGGLARAYGEAAAAALDAAPVRRRTRSAILSLACGFEDSGAVEAVLTRTGDAVLAVERSWDPGPAWAVTVRRSRADELTRAITEATAGRARVERTGGETEAGRPGGSRC